MHIQKWPEPVIELNRELASGLHPELERKLADLPGDEAHFIERFAVILTHCDIAVDGLYTSDNIVDMIDHAVLPRLIQRRVAPVAQEIILPSE